MKIVLFVHSLRSCWNHGNAHFIRGVASELVHEWNDPALVAALGAERARRPGLRLLFHDTHHRAATQRAARAPVLEEPGLARALADEGLATIRARHTCAHRVDELLDVLRRIG